jgi:hypothetical protein
MVDSACQSKNQAMRSKELSVELQDRIGSRNRSGERYQTISAALQILRNTVASIILNDELAAWPNGARKQGSNLGQGSD